MGERRDLLSIFGMLNISLCKDHQNESNVDLLQSIVDKLSVVKEPVAGGDQLSPPAIEGGARPTSKLELMLASNSLPDSLAFPTVASSKNISSHEAELWHELEKFHTLLKQDYSCRRQMLLNRLDCTVESFKWKASFQREKAKHQHQNKESLNQQIHEKYDQARLALGIMPNVTISHLLAVRETECDKLLNCIVSSSKGNDCQVNFKQPRQQSDSEFVNLKQIIIPHVPDRGGRTDEIRPPSKETFSQQRRARGRGGKR